MTPTNVEVLAEDRLVLTCTSAGKQSVMWRHLPTAATTLRDVYVNGTIAEPYSDRLTVEKDEATGAYSLTAFSLSIEDSGKYFCREENGNGDDENVAEIVVLGNIHDYWNEWIVDFKTSRLDQGALKIYFISVCLCRSFSLSMFLSPSAKCKRTQPANETQRNLISFKKTFSHFVLFQKSIVEISLID